MGASCSACGAVVPVARGPFCARGPLSYLQHMYVQQNCTVQTVVQYKKKGRTPMNERTNERTNEPRTKFHLIERILQVQVPARCAASEQCVCCAEVGACS